MRCNRCDYDGEELREHAAESGHPLCVVDARSLAPLESQTCGRCIARVRADLADIVYGLSILEPATYPRTSGPTDAARTDEDPLLGGDAIVLEGPGGLVWRTAKRRVSRVPENPGEITYGEIPGVDHKTGEDATHPAWTRQAVENVGAEHAADNWPTDTPSVLFELAAWEDDWRQTYDEPAGGEATATSVVAYLTGHLDTGHRAAQTHPAFDEFAAKVKRLAADVNRVTRHRPEVAVERKTCVSCEGDLERVIYDLDRPVEARLQAAAQRIAADEEILTRKPDAHVPERRDVVRRELTGDPKDGRLQQWVCRRCHAEYDREQFWNAVRARMEREREAG
jgi:hypothetical protein